MFVAFKTLERKKERKKEKRKRERGVGGEKKLLLDTDIEGNAVQL